MTNHASLSTEIIFEAVTRIHKDGTILEVIPDNREMNAHIVDMFVGQNVNAFASPKLLQKGMQIINQVLASGQATTLIQDFPTSHSKKNTFEIKIIASSHDEVITIVRDITEKKKAEADLLQLNRIFLSLQSASTSITSSLDNEYILNTFTWEMTNLLNIKGCIVSQWNQSDDTASYMASYPQHESGRMSDPDVSFKLDRYPSTKRVLQEQHAIQINARESVDFEFTEQLFMRKKGICTLLMLPLVFQNRAVGIIEIIEEHHRIFTNQEISIAQLLVNETAGALVNAQLYGHLERRLQDLAMLNEISLDLSSTLNPEKTLEIIPAKVQGLMGVTAVSIALLEPDQINIKYVSAVGSKAPFIQGRRLSLGKGIISQVIQNNTPLIIADAAADSRHYTEFDRETGFTTKSLLCVPLNTKGKAIGAITTVNKLTGPFDQDDLRLLTSVAASAAAAIENAQLYQRARSEIADRQRAEKALEEERSLLAQRVQERTAELDKQFQRQRAVAAIEPAINHPDELHGILQQIVDASEKMLPINGGVCIMLYDKVTDNFHLAVTSQNHPLQKYVGIIRKSAGASSKILQKKETYVVNDIANSQLKTSEFLKASGLRSYVGVPLIGQGEGLGIIYASSWEPRNYSQEELDFLAALADRAAVTISNVRLYEALQTTNMELARIATMKDEFLAGMSHELRTPLNAILGISEGLQEQFYGPLNERQVRSMQIVEESGRHLLTIINDILDVSKIESGQLSIEIEPIQVLHICESSLQFVKQSALKKKISINQNITQQVKIIHADARRMKQILINLLSNAVKFTLEGGAIGLEVKAGKNNNAIHFTVWDTGIGISEEGKTHLFQPFVQLDSSLSRRFAGTGLGLVLVKRMAELQGGTISVESEIGKGSRFTVTLPWQPSSDDDLQKPTTAPLQISDTNLGMIKEKPLILLAEDDKFNSEIFSQFLKMRGYEVRIAHTGKEALNYCEETVPDLILMDIQMPEMDGLEAIRQIRAKSLCEKTPIIALTALAMAGDRQMCLAAGANEYLSKPVPLQKLHQTIQTILQNQHGQSAEEIDEFNS
ncbi:MAG: GAF domain-containing protein [Chloroflexi bacterium]|nr:MAG: GAF domain-containing protein [Chloroflexota bacterium]